MVKNPGISDKTSDMEIRSHISQMQIKVQKLRNKVYIYI